MARKEHDHPVLDREEARQGITLRRMRYVLGISIALAVIALVIVFLTV